MSSAFTGEQGVPYIPRPEGQGFTARLIKKGRGDKVIAIHFTIKKNGKYIDQTTITDFIDTKQIETEGNAISAGFTLVHEDGIDMEFLADAFCNEFNVDQVEYLYRLALPYLQWNRPNMRLADVQIAMFDYFQLKYSQLKANAKAVKKSRYGLLRSFIEADAKMIG